MGAIAGGSKHKHNKATCKKKKRNRVARWIAEQLSKIYPGRKMFPRSSAIRYRLAKEQNWHCLYSGKPIKPALLLVPGYYEVDHILPFSRSGDNSFMNKVLVLSRENKAKKDMTPYEYLSSQGRWEEFVQRLKKLGLLEKLPEEKVERLLNVDFNS